MSTTSYDSYRTDASKRGRKRSPSPRRSNYTDDQTTIVGGGKLAMVPELTVPKLPRAPSSVNTRVSRSTNHSKNLKTGSVAGSRASERSRASSRLTTGDADKMALVVHSTSDRFKAPPSEASNSDYTVVPRYSDNPRTGSDAGSRASARSRASKTGDMALVVHSTSDRLKAPSEASNSDYTVVPKYLDPIPESTASHTSSNAPRKRSGLSDFTYTSRSYGNENRPTVEYRHVQAPSSTASKSQASTYKPKPPRKSSTTVVSHKSHQYSGGDPQSKLDMQQFMSDFGKMGLEPSTSRDRNVYVESHSRTTVTESHSKMVIKR
jgi:hypothetical protein